MHTLRFRASKLTRTHDVEHTHTHTHTVSGSSSLPRLIAYRASQTIMKRAWESAFGADMLNDIRKAVLELMQDGFETWEQLQLAKAEETVRKAATAQMMPGEDCTWFREYNRYRSERKRAYDFFAAKGRSAIQYWEDQLYSHNVIIPKCALMNFVNKRQGRLIKAFKSWRNLVARERAQLDGTVTPSVLDLC